MDNLGEDEALALAAAVESDSEHMIAAAIREAANERSIEPRAATELEVLKGRGVRATVEGETVYVGGPNLLSELGSDVPSALTEFADRTGKNAQTVIYLVREDEPVTAFALADVSREKRPLVCAAGYNAFAIPLAAGVLAPYGIRPSVGSASSRLQ